MKKKRSRELGLFKLLFHNLREDISGLDTNLVEVRVTFSGGSSGIGSDLGSISNSAGGSINSRFSVSDSGVPSSFVTGNITISDSLSISDGITNLSSDFGNRVGKTISSSA